MKKSMNQWHEKKKELVRNSHQKDNELLCQFLSPQVAS
jgi:hypothetical protein